jgi:hypothetical protein
MWSEPQAHTREEDDQYGEGHKHPPQALLRIVLFPNALVEKRVVERNVWRELVPG